MCKTFRTSGRSDGAPDGRPLPRRRLEPRHLTPLSSEQSPEGPLTAEQQAAVDVPADRATLVLAGPGTGKTFTLIARVDRLLQQGRQPLVLSFTRAVVRELHERLRRTGTDAARYLRPVTFDSFATRMLSAIPGLAGWRNWETSSFEGRISAAVAALEHEEEARRWLVDRFDHVVVDEVQDLVGRRARLVLSLLELVPAFTLQHSQRVQILGIAGRRLVCDLHLRRARQRDPSWSRAARPSAPARSGRRPAARSAAECH